MKRLSKSVCAILLGSVAVCVLALAGARWAVDAIIADQTKKLLGRSSDVFVKNLDNALAGMLWYSSSLAAYFLDYSVQPRSVEEMRNLADILYIDELTVVGTNGIAVASNYGEYVGFDWHSTPETSEYLELFDPDNKVAHLIQPFRKCVIHSEFYRKFAGVVFTNRLGLVQVGYAMDRLANTLRLAEAGAFNRWQFGRYGRFGAIDLDHDGFPDAVPESPTDNYLMDKVQMLKTPDGVWHRLIFSFGGRLFYAEVPEREFSDQRRAVLEIASATIILLVLAFTLMSLRIFKSSRKLAKLYEAADRRDAEDMKLAHAIQMSTLPHARSFNPESLSYDLDAVMMPAKEVGGDLYDFFSLADGRVAFVIGDVSGKGVPAAMFMLVAKNAIRQALHGQGDPAVAMAAANAALCEDNEAEMFVTMILGILDPVSGEVTYVNAGHNRPFVVRADGVVERLEMRGGRLLGVYPKLEYSASRFRVGAGDRLLLYTDGVTEAQNLSGALYGEARLKSLLATNPASICSAVCADVAAHVATAPASDDLTMLVITWRGLPKVFSRSFPTTGDSLRPALDFLREASPLSNHHNFARLLQVADEVITNVIDYSGASSFSLEVETGFDRCKFTLSDAGSEYNPLAYPEPDLHAPIEQRQIGGLGIFLARKLSDFISWRREDGLNRLTVVLYMK